MTGLRTPKKAYLRNAEYYDFQNVLDNLYALSKKEMIFTDLMKYISSEQIQGAGRQERITKQFPILQNGRYQH